MPDVALNVAADFLRHAPRAHQHLLLHTLTDHPVGGWESMGQVSPTRWRPADGRPTPRQRRASRSVPTQ